MRPGQNKRMRGRNRRGPNPLSRTFESNGPDVKVRGTAQHVAEKYTQLARDAHVSGDPVAAESYLQHAEHYFRIIATAHAAQVAIAAGTYDDREDDEDDFDSSNDRFTFRTPQAIALAQAGGNGERLGPDGQPLPEGEGDFIGAEPGMEAQTAQPPHRFPPREDRPHRDDRPHREDRPRGDRRPNRFERPFRPRPEGERQDGGRHEGNRAEGGRSDPPRFDGNRNEHRTEQPRFEAPRRPPQESESVAEQPILPAFLTTPSRAVPIEDVAQPAGDDAALRLRRRRRTRSPRVESEGGASPADAPDGESA